jgi:YVTN family beta-propeller protein
MSAQKRNAARIVGAVLVVLGGYAIAMLAASGGPSAGRALAPAAATAAQMPGTSAAPDEPTARAAQVRRRSFPYPTTSSPITMSRDGRYVWVVNPASDSVSIIRTSSNTVLRTVGVGDEPQSVALDPSNRYAFVANAAGSNVTVIRIRASGGTLRTQRARTLTTGAEPWNVVASPDGRRVFVANSGQDTITVIDALRPRIIGHVDLSRGRCNPDRDQHFQPRGLAVSRDSNRLYVTSFLAFTRPGGRQGDDNGRQGVVCRLRIDTESTDIDDYRPRVRVTLAAQDTGFTVDRDGVGTPEPTAAFPNQLQSIVIRGGQAYLPNIAASPEGPQRFNTSTQAFVNVINGVRQDRERDAAPGRFLNLHLGARQPEPGKKRLFFANPWAIAFTSQSGAGSGYVVSAGSDLLVKVRVAADGRIANTVDSDTTRYIDLNDPANAATSGANAGKNPQGIVIDRDGTRAYVANFVSRNVSVVDLGSDQVVRTIRTAAPPPAGSPAEVVAVGAEMFFSSRGSFNRPAGATVSTSERLSSEGWQGCSSCHFKGLTDGVIWEFASGPRKSVPLNPTFNPRNRALQRILNYSAIFDEIEDFEANVRNVSGPGALATPVACQTPPPAMSTLDPNHGLIIGDNGDINSPPCVINSLAKVNAERPQVTVTLPGSGVAVPAMTAMREWVRAAVRTPNGPLPRTRLRPGPTRADISAGRRLFEQQNCQSCHGGDLFTTSIKDFTSPPAAAEISQETVPPATSGAPVAVQYLARFLKDIGSFNLGVPGGGNEIGANVGADEKATQGVAAGLATPAQPPDALGRDYNGDGKGNGFNTPSLLGIHAVPPYYHNGACETLACVVGNVKHRTANGTIPDRLTSARARRQLVAWLQTVTARTQPVP